ncbi:uncharacterized protein [Procambarus clarkii]|uniref:uncharacterized protein n=1 Tax=Procambarus clarkii TaxID=6728 RepID=UPI003741EEA7
MHRLASHGIVSHGIASHRIAWHGIEWHGTWHGVSSRLASLHPAPPRLASLHPAPPRLSHGLVLLSLVMDPRRPSRLTVPWVEEDQTLQAATQVAAHRQNPHYPHHTGRLNDAPGTTAGPEVDLGESASVFKMDHDSRTTACPDPSDVKVEDDDSSDDDCLVIDLDESAAWMTTTAGHEVALGEAASRRTILPHSGVSHGRLGRSGVDARGRDAGVSAVRLTHSTDNTEVALGEAASMVGSTREVRLPRDSTSNTGVALGEAASRRTILPHPGVSLGRLAPGGVDEDEGVNAVKQAQDTPDDDDCTEVALGEAASRRTTLPHPGVSLGRLAPGGVDSRDDGKEAGATRPAHDATGRPEVALGEAASRGTPVGTTFGRTNPGASNVELVPDVTTITNDASPEDDPGIWTSWTTPSRTPFYSFTSGVGFSDLITSAPGIGSSDLTSKPRLASALHLRSSSTPADLGVGTSDASPGVGSSDTSLRTGTTNKHLRASACNTPLRAGPGSAKTSTTRADPSDDPQTATVPETGSGVGASDTRPGTDSTSKPWPEDEDRASPEASGEDNNDDQGCDESQIHDNGDEAVQLEQEQDEADQPEQQPDEAAQDWALEPLRSTAGIATLPGLGRVLKPPERNYRGGSSPLQHPDR